MQRLKTFAVFLLFVAGLAQGQSTGAAAKAASPNGAQARIDESWLRQLPMNRRSYFDFSLLTPAVGSAEQITGTGSNQNRVPSAPHSAFSFASNNGRGNSATVNGAEANNDFGGIRLTLGQDAVEEFKVRGGDAPANTGNACGASLEAVAKRGGNQVHGSLSGFFTDDALNARNPLSFGAALQPRLAADTYYDPIEADVSAQAVKAALSRQQFGGAVGFPLRKDKTFAFASVEGMRADGQVSVPTLTNTSIYRPTALQAPILEGLAGLGSTPVPCLTGQPALPASVCAVILTNILTMNSTTNPLNQFITQQFWQNSGLLPYEGTSTLATGRLDHRFSERNQLYLMYSFGQDNELNPNAGGFTTLSRSGRVNEFSHAVQGGWTHQFNPNLVNQVLLQLSYTRFDLTSNDQGGVGIDIPGYALFGSSLYSPSSSLMRHYQAADNLTVVRGSHTMTMGGSVLVRGNRNNGQALSAGVFTFSDQAGGILSPCLQVPAACGLAADTRSAVISPLQSLSLGLPAYYEQGFTDNAYVAYTTPLSAAYWQDAWKVRSNLTLNFGVRYEVDGRYAPLNSDTDNVAPRFSFAWDPTNGHKMLVRGGFGMFFGPLGAQMDYLAHALADVNGTRQVPVVMVPLVSGGPVNAAEIFVSLFGSGKIQCASQAGNCITAADLAAFGITPSQTGTIPQYSALFGANPNIQNPYSQQGNFGIQRELGGNLTVSADYVHVHTLRLPQSTDANLLPAPVVATGPGAVPIENWSGCGSCFVNPNLVQNNVVSSTGAALYDAGIFQANKQFSNHFSLLANYTYSKAIDDVTDYNAAFAAFNQLSHAGDRSLSSFDQRHSFALAAVLQSPWQGGSSASLGSKILSGFGISPVLRATSGHPFNALAGVDVNGDHNLQTDRPAGAPRNSGTGPDFFGMDLRVSREFQVTEKGRLQFIAEGFNILNRANFTGVNNFVGSVAGPFNYKADASLSPSQPLGYTAANAGRQMQFGARFEF